MNHENTRIYKRAVELNTRCAALILELPPGLGFLADEARRASSSVILNFAEGCCRETAKERRRFFMIARGSAAEVSAIADVALAHGVVSPEDHGALKEASNHLAAMLTLFR